MKEITLMTFEAGYQINRSTVPTDTINMQRFPDIMKEYADITLQGLNQYRKSNHYWLEIQHERTAYRYYFEDGQTKPGIIYQF